jgi:hypothetical protein
MEFRAAAFRETPKCPRSSLSGRSGTTRPVSTTPKAISAVCTSRPTALEAFEGALFDEAADLIAANHPPDADLPRSTRRL